MHSAARRRFSGGLIRGGLLAITATGGAGPACLTARDAAASPRDGAGDLRPIAARARPSVLPVGTYSATASPRFGFRGSGFVVGDGRLVATNAHVLPPAGAAEPGHSLAVLARTAGPGREAGDLRLATLVAQDRAHDLALLRLEGAPLPALALAGGERVAEGLPIALVGFPIGGALGFAPVVHRGIVASVTTAALPAPTAAQLDPRAVARLRAGNFEVLQLDATAYPGNSGGPVLDADTGEVIGVVNMVLVRGSRETALSAPTGITYAIPVRHLRTLLDEAAAAPPR
ncbi:MAG: trypsin-like peptidase domain-containing protein [Rubrivivax sp.]|nr:trypsin-like peptidase domain-containing protein [Rubrivivax sp.]